MKISTRNIYLIYAGMSALLYSIIKMIREVYRLEVVELDPFQLVIIGTTLEVTNFIFEIPTGVIADRVSRKLSVVIGLILIGISFLIEGLLPFFIVVLFSQIILGIGSTFTSGADEAYIADELEGVGLEKLFLDAAQIGQLLSIFGVIISTLLGMLYLNLPFIISGTLFILLSIFLMFFMKETKFNRRIQVDNPFIHLKNTFLFIRKKPVLIFMTMISFLYGLYSEGFDRLWTAHFLKDTDLPQFLSPVVWIGLLSLVAMGLSIVAVMYIKKRLSKTGKLEKVWLLFSINLLMVVTLFAFAITGQFYIASSLYFSFYVVRRINTPIYKAWMNEHIESNIRATVLSSYGQIDSLGQIIGGPIIGLIALKTSIPFAMMVSSLLLSPVLILYLIFIRKARSNEYQL